MSVPAAARRPKAPAYLFSAESQTNSSRSPWRHCGSPPNYRPLVAQTFRAVPVRIAEVTSSTQASPFNNSRVESGSSIRRRLQTQQWMHRPENFPRSHQIVQPVSDTDFVPCNSMVRSNSNGEMLNRVFVFKTPLSQPHHPPATARSKSRRDRAVRAPAKARLNRRKTSSMPTSGLINHRT